MLSVFQISIVVGFTANFVLGLIVFSMNPARRANRHFLTTSIALDLWFLCMILGIFAKTERAQVFWFRHSHFVAILLPVSFDLLRLAIAHANEKWSSYVRALRPWLALFVVAGVLTESPLLLTGVRTTEGSIMPVFGVGQIPYIALWLGALTLLAYRYAKDLAHTQGIERVELQFVLLGATLAPFVGVTLGNVLPMISGSGALPQAMPLSVILLDCVIAYGIVTRRIMNVTDVLRRSTAYALLTVYLALFYLAIFVTLRLAFSFFLPYADMWAQLIAAIALAFSVAPAHGWMQRFANRLFINVESVDARAAIQQARQVMMTIATTDELLERFADIARSATGTDNVAILLADKEGFSQTYPPPVNGEGLHLDRREPLVVLLRDQSTPVSLDGLRRQRPSDMRKAAGSRLQALNASLAVGVRTKGHLDGVVLLGSRLSGKIYGVHEQDALQFFCEQIGVSLENSRLYTAVQDGKIYNDILLDSLVSGVIAANADRVVTVFNREAQRITGRAHDQVIEHGIAALPSPLAAVIHKTLDTNSGVWDHDLSIGGDDGDEVPIRLSSSVFHSHTGDCMGVLVVLNDMTLVRKLEEQVRRTDRLASLGTLSAGMAHEIKNPLVSIKTFTQLLPERYMDEEFRETFSELIGKEVTRIDSIVNRLLHFSRPTKPQLVPVHVHEVLHSALRLISQQLRRHEIELTHALDADADLIRGDVDLLSQAFINFFLNAIESMEKQGRLTVTTCAETPSWHTPVRGVSNGAKCLRVDITDTGVGIGKEVLTRIFDPFYTTKSSGTGLGLSVAHGIIQDHGATVDVESKLGEGATFHVSFPLIDQEEESGSDERAADVHSIHAG